MSHPSYTVDSLPRWLSGKEPACECRRPGFDPWVRKIPWSRKWRPTPVFLLGESHGPSLVGYSLCGHKELDMTGHLSNSNSKNILSGMWKTESKLTKIWHNKHNQKDNALNRSISFSSDSNVSMTGFISTCDCWSYQHKPISFLATEDTPKNRDYIYLLLCF